MKSLGDQVRDAVRRSKLGRNEIARQCGIDKASLSKFVSGERGLELAALDKLAALLNLEITQRKEK